MTDALIMAGVFLGGFFFGVFLFVAVRRDQRRTFLMHVDSLADVVTIIAKHTNDGRIPADPVLEALAKTREEFQ